jgi:CheY-like chemotaxis protein
VIGNEARIGQVLLNLLVNAAQAIPEGRADDNRIHLHAFVQGAQVIIEVSDTGTGMTPDVQRRLFTPFFTTKPVGVGTGLGLSVCQRIISQHGGTISVTSRAGKGTTFRVSLPAALDAEIPDEAEPQSVPMRARRRGRVLIVDDEPMIGHLVRRALGTEHDVTALTSAVEALDRIRSGERYDVILSDLMMPRMTGMDFYSALGDVAPDLVERIIFLTGGSFTPRARTFLEEAPNVRLEKPFDVPALRAVVNEHVR